MATRGFSATTKAFTFVAIVLLVVMAIPKVPAQHPQCPRACFFGTWAPGTVNQGIRAELNVYQTGHHGETTAAYWVSEKISRDLWAQVGWSDFPVYADAGFVQVWNLTSFTVYTTTLFPVGPGIHSFGFQSSGGNWTFFYDDQVVLSRAFDGNRSVMAYDEDVAEEIQGVYVVPTSLPSGMQVLAHGTWSNVTDLYVLDDGLYYGP